MAGKHDKKDAKGGVIVKKYEIVEGGHHGGAWKVAYADFVTAMMAFFLLMWLLNATTEDQRKGLADYFSPNNLMSHALLRHRPAVRRPYRVRRRRAGVRPRRRRRSPRGKRPGRSSEPRMATIRVYTDAHRANIRRRPSAQAPPADDQDADDDRRRSRSVRRAARPAPGPGGTSVVERQGQPADARPITASRDPGRREERARKRRPSNRPRTQIKRGRARRSGAGRASPSNSPST